MSDTPFCRRQCARRKHHVLVYGNRNRNFRVMRNFFFIVPALFSAPSLLLTAASAGTLGLFQNIFDIFLRRAVAAVLLLRQGSRELEGSMEKNSGKSCPCCLRGAAVREKMPESHQWMPADVLFLIHCAAPRQERARRAAAPTD